MAVTATNHAGTGRRHGAENGEEGVTGLWEKPSNKSYRVDGGEGGYETSGVALNNRGDCQGVGGGIKSQRGTKPPGLEGLTHEEKPLE